MREKTNFLEPPVTNRGVYNTRQISLAYVAQELHLYHD